MTDIGRDYINFHSYGDLMKEKISKSSIFHPSERIHSNREHHLPTPNKRIARYVDFYFSDLYRILKQTETT